MKSTHTELVELLLGQLPTEDEAPHVVSALRAGAGLVRSRPGLTIVAVQPGSLAAQAGHVLRPGRTPIQQLVALGLEVHHQAEAARQTRDAGALAAHMTERAEAAEDRLLAANDCEGENHG